MPLRPLRGLQRTASRLERRAGSLDHPFRVIASCCSYSGFYLSFHCSLEPLFVSGPQHSVDTSPALMQCPLVKSSETPALAPCTAAINL